MLKTPLRFDLKTGEDREMTSAMVHALCFDSRPSPSTVGDSAVG
tara:strand:- start:279 stop:410 length:132 start_codon:yes stop_codon:yes gene_type:complete